MIDRQCRLVDQADSPGFGDPAMVLGRRDLLRGLATVLSTAVCRSGFTGPLDRDEPIPLPPVRRLTSGPRHHWFGYYDKREFDPSGRYVLGMEVGFEHRTPTPDDAIALGMVDLRASDRWIALGESHAWCWQQGCMLQWLPGSKTEVIWNDRQDGRFVSHILDVVTRSRRTLPAPIYAISPDGRWAIAPDFRRLHDMRPGYGYAGIPDPGVDVKAPDDAGLWRLDLESGRIDLLFSFATIARLPGVAGAEMDATAKHWFNHLLVSPDGARFSFLHRWRGKAQGTGFATRLITADADGTNPYVLDPHGKTSHYDLRGTRGISWRSPTTPRTADGSTCTRTAPTGSRSSAPTC